MQNLLMCLEVNLYKWVILTELCACSSNSNTTVKGQDQTWTILILRTSVLSYSTASKERELSSLLGSHHISGQGMGSQLPALHWYPQQLCSWCPGAAALTWWCSSCDLSEGYCVCM